LRVGSESAGFDVVLDKIEEEDEDESTSESSESFSEEETITDYYKVYIDAPENVEVYLDGNYVGISPCSFRKVAGTHVITLRKTGYESRSYTVQIDDEEKDFSYSFVDLETTTTTPTETVEATRETIEATQETTEVIQESSSSTSDASEPSTEESEEEKRE